MMGLGSMGTLFITGTSLVTNPAYILQLLKDRAWRWRGSGMKCVCVHVSVCVVCVGGRDKNSAEAKLPQVSAQMKGQDLG